MPADELSTRFEDALMGKLRQTKYPSAAMLDRIEAAISDRRAAEAYVSELIERLERDDYPSPAIVQRVGRLLGSF